MRIPIRSEPEAFRFVVGLTALAVVAALVGWLTDAIVGVAILALGVLVALVAYARAPNPDRRMPLRDAQHAPHPHGAADGARHVLVIANEVPSGADLKERLRARERERVEVDVLAPVLTSPLHYGVSDVDAEIRDARARLARSLAWMRDNGIVARGEVGDPSPASAIEDELRDFGADEVVVVTRAPDRASWQEHGELDHLRRELDVPVAHVVVD